LRKACKLHTVYLNVIMKPTLYMLCAGRGTRMGELTKSLPKALLPVHGVPIIEHSVCAFRNSSVSGAVKCIGGYQSEELNAWVKRKNFGNDVSILVNSSWDKYGPIVSAAIAANDMQGKSIVMLANGDTLFGDNFIQQIAEKISSAHPGIYLAGSLFQYDDDDAMLLEVEDGCVVAASKNLDPVHVPYESSGFIFAIGGGFVKKLSESISEMADLVVGGKMKDGPWHDVVNRLCEKNVKVLFHEVSIDGWYECDTQECILHAESSKSS